MGKSGGEYYDVAIIGGGPAGMSAALWCAELELRSVLIEARSELGGQLLHVHNRIENYPGVSTANGRELRDLFLKSLEERKFDTRLNSPVAAADLTAKKLTLETGEVIHAKSVIIATGVRRKKLGVPGEEEFTGRGILSSGTKEAETVKGKSVLIVGGGDAALENALILGKHASKIIVVHRRNEFSSRPDFVAEAESRLNIEFKYENEVHGFFGDEVLRYVEVLSPTDDFFLKINTDYALIRIGVEPNTDRFGDSIKLDEHGYLGINSACHTEIAGVYATGDVANALSPTISNACGTGTTAAKAASAWLNAQKAIQ